MASPTETAARAQGFGARRFLVRGRTVGPESGFAELRGLINEYPERVPLIPGFPLAGRRGGSRARAQVLAEGEGPSEPLGLYPAARERSATALQNVTTGLTADQLANLSSARRIGFPRAPRMAVAAGVTSVTPSVPLPGPAIITRLEITSDIVAIQPFVDVGFRYATDDNTTGGFATSGSRFFLAGSAEFDVNLALDTLVWTPNVLVPHSRWFLKIIIRNNQAGTINVISAVSIDWL